METPILSGPDYLATMSEETGHITYDGRIYKEFAGGIGWLFPKGEEHYSLHWLVVTGLGVDGLYHVVHEFGANMHQLCQEATDVKDRLFVSRFYADQSQPQLMSTVREHDGLTRYITHGTDLRGRTKWLHQPERWQHFRDRDTVATLMPVSDRIRVDLQAGIDKVVGLISDRKLEISWECPRVIWVLRQSIEEWHIHPIMRALVWSVIMMEPSDTPKIDYEPPKPLYGNLRKRTRR